MNDNDNGKKTLIGFILLTALLTAIFTIDTANATPPPAKKTTPPPTMMEEMDTSGS